MSDMDTVIISLFCPSLAGDGARQNAGKAQVRLLDFFY